MRRAGPGMLLSLLLLAHAPLLPAQTGILLEDVEFRLTPPRLRWCGKPVERTEVQLHWDVTSTGATRVVIYLEEVGGKTFHAGRAEGRRRTGEWVTDGMKFLLYLPEQEQLAAEYTFRLLPCNTQSHPG